MYTFILFQLVKKPGDSRWWAYIIGELDGRRTVPLVILILGGEGGAVQYRRPMHLLAYLNKNMHKEIRGRGRGHPTTSRLLLAGCGPCTTTAGVARGLVLLCEVLPLPRPSLSCFGFLLGISARIRLPATASCTQKMHLPCLVQPAAWHRC